MFSFKGTFSPSRFASVSFRAHFSHSPLPNNKNPIAPILRKFISFKLDVLVLNIIGKIFYQINNCRDKKHSAPFGLQLLHREFNSSLKSLKKFKFL